MKKLLSLGIGSQENFENSRIYMTNLTTLIAVFITLTYDIVYVAYDLWNPVLFNIGVLMGFSTVFLLNYYGKTISASLLLIGVAITQLFFIPLIFLGAETGIHYYLMAVFALTFLVISRKHQKPVLSIVFLITIGLFIVTEYGDWKSPFLSDTPPALANLFHLFSTTGSIMMITVVILIFSLRLNKAQEELKYEHNRAESLLLNILPSPIAQRLKNNPGIIADDFENTSILFTDFVNFTSFSKAHSSQQLVEWLNQIFSDFDSLVEKYTLEKIKTIGDSYMVAGGLNHSEESQVLAMADLALAMCNKLDTFNQSNNLSVDIRIGLHTGPLVAGVIGTKKFYYDVWGDTVNIASKMESQSIPGKIQVSETVYHILKQYYRLSERGEILIYGNNKMKTYFLEGKL